MQELISCQILYVPNAMIFLITAKIIFWKINALCAGEKYLKYVTRLNIHVK